MKILLLNLSYKLNLLSILIALVFSLQSTAQNTTCDSTIPDNSACVPPTTFHYQTVNDGSWYSKSTWLNGNVPNNIYNKKIKITHNVYITNDDLKLDYKTILYVSGDNSSLTLKNGNFFIEGSGAKAIFENTILRTSGNVEQKSNTSVCMYDVELTVGEETAGFNFVPEALSTTANFKNDGGYRWLEFVCGNITSNFENLGTDYIINSYFDIGDQGDADKLTDGQDSGDFVNEKGSMKIWDSEFVITNGNFQNLDALQVCDARFKILNGNSQNVGQITGQNIVLWQQKGDIQNDGSWNGSTFSAWYNKNGNNPQGINSLPSESNQSTIANFFIGCQDPIVCEATSVGTATGPTNGAVLGFLNQDNFVSLSPNGDAVLPTGYVIGTVLTSNTDETIVSASNNTTLLLPEVLDLMPDYYTIYLFAYNPATINLEQDIMLGFTTNTDLQNLLLEGSVCGDLDEVGINIIVIPAGSTDRVNLNTNDKSLASDSIKLYPNPVADNLNIKLQLLEEEVVNFSVIDLNGRQILSGSLDHATHGNTTVNTSHLPNGFYMINFNSNHRSFSKKVLVNH